MKRLRPQDIDESRSYGGYKPRQIRAMAEHYGFEQIDHGDSKHLRFAHRDYHDLGFNMQHGQGEVGKAYVENVVDACLEVKRRNALRKEPVFQKIPGWVWKALPDGLTIANSDNRVHFEAGGVMDLDAADTSAVRHYMLEMRDGKLSIRNLDYPLENFSTSFTVRDGSSNIPGLKVMFDQVDAKVSERTQQLAACFNNELSRLEHHHGFTVRRENGLFSRHLVIDHPVHAERLELVAPKEGQAIAEESSEQLHALLERSRERCMEQMELLEELQMQGWHAQHHPVNGSAACLKLEGPQGQQVEVPTHGLHAVFDEALLKKLVQEAPARAEPCVKPDATMEVTPAESVTKTAPVVDDAPSPTVAGPKVVLGSLSLPKLRKAPAPPAPPEFVRKGPFNIERSQLLSSTAGVWHERTRDEAVHTTKFLEQGR